MCATVLEENLRRTGANLDHDEAFSRLVLQAWRLYLAFDAERGLTFESFAFGILRRRAHDIYRELLGRHGEKPLANAVSMDALFGNDPDDRLWGEFLGSDEGDPATASLGEARFAMLEGRAAWQP